LKSELKNEEEKRIKDIEKLKLEFEYDLSNQLNDLRNHHT